VQNEEEVVDSNVLPYCSIDRKTKKTIGEMEQEFLGALQVRLRHFFFGVPLRLLREQIICPSLLALPGVVTN
jgi:hypothetical protein